MWRSEVLYRVLEVLLLAAAVAVSAFAGEPEEQMRMWRCVRRVQVPDFSPVARSARLTGTAVATVTLGKGGAVERVEIVGAQSPHKREVERAIAASEFSPECGGERLSFLFIFSLRYPPEELRRSSFAFSPPNRFFISVAAPLLNP